MKCHYNEELRPLKEEESIFPRDEPPYLFSNPKWSSLNIYEQYSMAADGCICIYMNKRQWNELQKECE